MLERLHSLDRLPFQFLPTPVFSLPYLPILLSLEPFFNESLPPYKHGLCMPTTSPALLSSHHASHPWHRQNRLSCHPAITRAPSSHLISKLSFFPCSTSLASSIRIEPPPPPLPSTWRCGRPNFPLFCVSASTATLSPFYLCSSQSASHAPQRISPHCHATLNPSS